MAGETYYYDELVVGKDRVYLIRFDLTNTGENFDTKVLYPTLQKHFGSKDEEINHVTLSHTTLPEWGYAHLTRDYQHTTSEHEGYSLTCLTNTADLAKKHHQNPNNPEYRAPGILNILYSSSARIRQEESLKHEAARLEPINLYIQQRPEAPDSKALDCPPKEDITSTLASMRKTLECIASGAAKHPQAADAQARAAASAESRSAAAVPPKP